LLIVEVKLEVVGPGRVFLELEPIANSFQSIVERIIVCGGVVEKLLLVAEGHESELGLLATPQCFCEIIDGNKV